MRKFSIGKYKNILISIALFLILDASVLMLNFYISFQIAEDATSINLAGRQRMLSQRMTKSLLDLDYSYLNQEQREKVLKELALSRNLFDETFTSFDLGGEATGAGGNKVKLNKANDTGSLSALGSAKPIWNAYKEKIDIVISDSNNKDKLSDAISFGQANNLLLLKLMNDLTVSLEQVAASKAERLRLIQTAGIMMALVNFFIILFHFIGQLRKGDEIVEEARKETADILLTVNEGLFLIHKNFKIGKQRSEKLHEIFHIKEDQNINFESLLKDIVTTKDLESAMGFLRLLFNPKIKEKLIGDLNPLDKVQVNIDGGTSGYQTKYLSFDFNRVMHGDEVVDVLATVNDITKSVMLEKELAEAKESNEKQIEMLTTILHANPSLLSTFLDNAYNSFSKINGFLKRPAKTQQQFKDKINDIFSEIHNFKGESGALDLTEFVAMAHEFEDDLALMRDSVDIKGQDFLSLAVRLDRLINYAQDITALTEKLSNFTATIENSSNNSIADKRLWDHLYQLVDELGNKYNKKVSLVCSGLNELPESLNLHETINSICIQFIRNSIVHGIETPETRQALQKNMQGRIDIRVAMTSEGVVEMMFKDDGAGFDFDKLRRRALTMGQATVDEIEHWDNKRLLSLIFTPGFSTADKVSDDAGRGVGMDVVVKKIKAVKGKINISHKPNQFSRFVITFPSLSISKAA